MFTLLAAVFLKAGLPDFQQHHEQIKRYRGYSERQKKISV